MCQSVHTHACGKTCVCDHGLYGTVHPHRVEENSPIGGSAYSAGPTPRVWGKLSLDHRRVRVAGPSPRVWGNDAGKDEATYKNGPSPRVWGKLFGCRGVIPVHRSIPTRVGKTAAGQRRAGPCSVHPHACGENGNYIRHRQDGNGPSPRVWGKLDTRAHALGRVRSIPTRVGKTPPGRSGSPARSVHPHACGENCGAALAPTGTYGPSPRVWGKPGGGRGSRRERRSIPTRVGKTTM